MKLREFEIFLKYFLQLKVIIIISVLSYEFVAR